MYRLIFLKGKDRGKRLAIKDPIITLGRDQTCSIRIEDDEVSRKHAVIEQKNDGVYIKDLNATNPTLVNDKPIREARLQNGDRIELGNTVLEFQTLSEITSAERRTSYLEGLTTFSVSLIIIVQLLFLAFLASRHKRVVEEPGPTVPSLTSSESVVRPVEPPPSARQPSRDEQPAVRPSAEPSASQGEETVSDRANETSPALTSLRTEVEALRREVEEIAAEPLEVAAQPELPPPVASNVAEPAPPTEEADAVLLRAEAMLREAAAEIARMNLMRADDLLQRIQIMAPDFLPAYVERARLFEQRGMLKQASEQWAEVLTRSIGTPLYEQAAAERIRIARLAASPTARPMPATVVSATDQRLPRRIRIVNIEQERFPKNEQFEEFRLLRITLKPRPAERDLDPSNVKVVVTFFDENVETQQVRPTRVITSKSLSVDHPWQPNQTKTISATYVAPRGFRRQEFEHSGERMLYYGYVVQVYYREQLQDVEYKPAALASHWSAIPTPFHTPAAGRTTGFE